MISDEKNRELQLPEEVALIDDRTSLSETVIRTRRPIQWSLRSCLLLQAIACLLLGCLSYWICEPLRQQWTVARLRGRCPVYTHGGVQGITSLMFEPCTAARLELRPEDIRVLCEFRSVRELNFNIPYAVRPKTRKGRWPAPAGLTYVAPVDAWSLSGYFVPLSYKIDEYALSGDENLKEFLHAANALIALRAEREDPPILLGRIDDSALAILSSLTELEVLFLGGNPITDEGVAHLEGLTKLIALNLEGTRVTDAGLRHLTGLTSLTHLCLESTSVTDAGLFHIREIKSLERLFLGDTAVTREGVERLQRDRPSLVIFR